MHISCLPTVPLHLKSLGKVAVTRVGSGTGPIGSLTVTPTLGSVCAMAAKPATPAPAAIIAVKAYLMAERILLSPWIYGEMIGRNCDAPQFTPLRGAAFRVCEMVAFAVLGGPLSGEYQPHA